MTVPEIVATARVCAQQLMTIARAKIKRGTIARILLHNRGTLTEAKEIAEPLLSLDHGTLGSIHMDVKPKPLLRPEENSQATSMVF